MQDSNQDLDVSAAEEASTILENQLNLKFLAP
jgi:hypothetical protein